MPRILHPARFATAPWKNGGGITHEIAREEDARGLLWRLSIAEVAASGPFSRFEGLSRILTVTQGAGLVLETPEGDIEARPLEPVAFSGDLAVTGRLRAGPVRDLNVIHDAGRIEAAVALVATPGALAPDGVLRALLVLAGRAQVDGAPCPAGSVALGRGGRVTLEAGTSALLVTLRGVGG